MIERIKNLQHELLQKIEFKLSRAQLAWLEKTEILLNQNLRTTLGRANLRHNRIELNPILLKQHPHELEPTFAHELAHLVAPLLFGKRGCAHQDGWRMVMHFFGYPPERTHRLPVGELRRQHRVAAKACCGCIGFTHEIKPRRLFKIRSGRYRYHCVKCREELRLIS